MAFTVSTLATLSELYSHSNVPIPRFSKMQDRSQLVQKSHHHIWLHLTITFHHRCFCFVSNGHGCSSSSSFEGYPLQIRHKQDWGRGFILLLPQTAALPESDAGRGVIKPASSFVIQNRQTSCSMWCPIYRARC